MDTIKCNDLIEHALRMGNGELEESFEADVIILKAAMRQPIDDAIKDEIEEIKKNKESSGDKLLVIVETTGGYIETVERIVSVFRRHYGTVEFVVPNYAYSAGTILVLSGDEIYMDYYSVLGPIDPQLEGDDGYSLLPGLGYLAKYEELVRVINDPDRDPRSTRAEMAYLISKFEPAKLFLIEQSIEHAKQLLRDWLPKYKFKNWHERETSGLPVSPEDRQKRADEIAEVLGDARRWHSHGRGISIRELASEEIKLKVINYGEKEGWYRSISNYYGLFIDYLGKRGFNGGLHSKRGMRRLA